MTGESFLTLEDINTTLYSNQGFWWHEIDTSIIGGSDDFDWIKIDFCQIKRETLSNSYKFSVKVDNEYWTNGYAVLTLNYNEATYTPHKLSGGGGFYADNVSLDVPRVKIMLYMGSLKILNSPDLMSFRLKKDVINLNLKELNIPQKVEYRHHNGTHNQYFTKLLNQGQNLITSGSGGLKYGYLLVNLLKSDFKFDCTQQLIVGKVNKVQLGTDSDYKPNGDLVGEYETKLSVQYGDKTLPVYWDSSVNDYCFDLDLSDKTTTGKIRFTVNVETNEVLNQTSTEVTLVTEYETINTLSDFTSFISNGGIGRLGANITLTSPITVNKDVYIIGNDKTITMSGNQFIISADKTFKAENLTFSGGFNAIHQKNNTKVELTDCTFVDCTGTGSAIECDIELHSLDNPTDFTTILNDCSFSNCDMCILHGGDLQVNNCNVTGKIADSNYPYFLYMTDGNATLLQNNFNISSNSQITTDIEFNSCIFVCGETAQINSLSHSELQNNNITAFLDIPQNNQSSIDLTYYYDLIEDYITLQSDKGYCHSVSGVDYVFKTGVQAQRSD